MITIRTLTNRSIMSQNYHFIFVVRTFKIYSCSNFQLYNTLLLIVITMLYIKSSDTWLGICTL